MRASRPPWPSSARRRSPGSLDELMAEAADAAALELGTEFASVLELTADGLGPGRPRRHGACPTASSAG